MMQVYVTQIGAWMLAVVLLGGCGGARTHVVNPPTLKRSVSAVAVVVEPAAVAVPEDIQATFQSKLTTALYADEVFKPGTELTMRYRFVQFDPGSQVARYFAGPLGGKGTLTIEVRYLDGTQQELARIQSTGSVTAGIAGGPMEDALDRAADEIVTYTKAHFR